MATNNIPNFAYCTPKGLSFTSEGRDGRIIDRDSIVNNNIINSDEKQPTANERQ